MIRTKTCPTCGTNFSYEVGKGRDRKHCSDGCRRKHQLAMRAERYEYLPECSVELCNNKATRVSHGMCETHYTRVRRTGTTEKSGACGRYRTGSGYIKLLMPDHELADSGGLVFEHRAIAYEMHNGECPNCFWCGVSLSWNIAVVDHLNEKKDDNSESNLVVACNNCNRARGAMMPLVARLKPQSLKVFIECIEKYHSSESVINQ